MGRVGKIIWVVVVAALVLPIAANLVLPDERRSFRRASLGEVPFQEVSFRNQDQGLQLAGLLFMPSGDGDLPAVVVIHGSGTSRRDSSWYLTLAHYLYGHGIAVLLPDKRGSEKSEGNWRRASFHDLATDTVAGVTFLKNLDRVSRVGVVGMSQGGHIAPLVATLSSDVEFVVNMVGAAVPMHDQLYYEEVHNLREFGILPGLADALALLTTRLIIHGSQREFWDAIGNYDPLAYWEQVSIPSLVLLGEEDSNVPSARSAERLRQLGNPNIRVMVFEASGHALESPPGSGDSLIRQDALDQIRALAFAASD